MYVCVRCQEVNQSTRGLPFAKSTTSNNYINNNNGGGGGVSWDFIVKGELKKHNITDISGNSNSTLEADEENDEETIEIKKNRKENKFWLNIIQNTLQQDYQVRLYYIILGHFAYYDSIFNIILSPFNIDTLLHFCVSRGHGLAIPASPGRAGLRALPYSSQRHPAART